MLIVNTVSLNTIIGSSLNGKLGDFLSGSQSWYIGSTRIRQQRPEKRWLGRRSFTVIQSHIGTCVDTILVYVLFASGHSVLIFSSSSDTPCWLITITTGVSSLLSSCFVISVSLPFIARQDWRVAYDPFLLMQDEKKVYGFTLSLYEYIETIPTLWDAVKGASTSLKCGTSWNIRIHPGPPWACR